MRAEAGARRWAAEPAGDQTAPAPSPQLLAPVLRRSCAGLLLWFVPLVIVTGGPAAYWRALFEPGRGRSRQHPDALDRARRARRAGRAVLRLRRAVGGVAGRGGGPRLRGARGRLVAVDAAPSALIALAVAFGPYLVFDLLFQETFTSRYALPLVVPMAYLAACRAAPAALRVRPAPWLSRSRCSTRTSAARRSRPSRAQKAPAFRLLDDMRRSGAVGARAAGAGDGSPAVVRLPPADRVGRRARCRRSRARCRRRRSTSGWRR